MAPGRADPAPARLDDYMPEQVVRGAYPPAPAYVAGWVNRDQFYRVKRKSLHAWNHNRALGDCPTDCLNQCSGSELPGRNRMLY